MVLGMHFASSKYKMLLKGWTSSKLNFVLAGEDFVEIDKSPYLGTYLSPNGSYIG